MVRNLVQVPVCVKERVKKYLDENLPEYYLIDVFRKSDHPDDKNLYMVIAKNCSTGFYAIWTCWNDVTEVLSHGHYMIDDIMEAYKIMVDNYYSIKNK